MEYDYLKYLKYLSDKLDNSINYSEYLANKLGNSINYSEYLAEPSEKLFLIQNILQIN